MSQKAGSVHQKDAGWDIAHARYEFHEGSILDRVAGSGIVIEHAVANMSKT